MKPVVLITNKIPLIITELIEQYFQIKFLEKGLNEQNFQEYDVRSGKAENIYALFTFVTDKVSESIISLLPKTLKIISHCAVGHNNIDSEACLKRNIIVTNTPGILTDATADLTFALILSVSRRILEGHNLIVTNKFSGWQPDLLLGEELSGKTLGIIGLGRIGQAVARRAKAFNMNIIYHSRKPRDIKVDQEEKIYYKSLPDLLKEADFISIHVSLGPESYHLITKKELESMKETAYLINTSRGECIKETDLVNALKEKKIAGAALDVFEFEPKVTEELKTMSNVVLTPHIGSATIETRQKMAEIAAQNIINLYLGKEPVYRVN